MSKIFKVPCTWETYGVLLIEADSVEEAIEKANAPGTPLPTDGNYIEDSFRIDDKELIEEFQKHAK